MNEEDEPIRVVCAPSVEGWEYIGQPEEVQAECGHVVVASVNARKAYAEGKALGLDCEYICVLCWAKRRSDPEWQGHLNMMVPGAFEALREERGSEAARQAAD